MTVVIGVVTVTVVTVGVVTVTAGVVTVTAVIGVTTVTVVPTVADNAGIGGVDTEMVGTWTIDGDCDAATSAACVTADAGVASPPEPSVDAEGTLGLEPSIVFKGRRAASNVSAPPTVSPPRAVAPPVWVASAAAVSGPGGSDDSGDASGGDDPAGRETGDDNDRGGAVCHGYL